MIGKYTISMDPMGVDMAGACQISSINIIKVYQSKFANELAIWHVSSGVFKLILSETSMQSSCWEIRNIYIPRKSISTKLCPLVVGNHLLYIILKKHSLSWTCRASINPSFHGGFWDAVTCGFSLLRLIVQVPGCGSGPFGTAAVDYQEGIRWGSYSEKVMVMACWNKSSPHKFLEVISG